MVTNVAITLSQLFIQSAIKEYRKQAQEDKVDRRLERVIVYRDGVSEGEFEQVRQQEIGPIKGVNLVSNIATTLIVHL